MSVVPNACGSLEQESQARDGTESDHLRGSTPGMAGPEQPQRNPVLQSIVTAVILAMEDHRALCVLAQ